MFGISRHEAAEVGGVVASAEVVEAALTVAFFAGEHEGDVDASGVGGATGGNGPLAAEGVVIGATAIGVTVAVDATRVAEGVREEMVHPIVRFATGQKHAIEIVVFIHVVAGAVGLFKDLRAGAIPVEIVGLSGRTGGGFADAFAVAVVEVGHAAGGGEMVFGVEDVGATDGTGLDQVSCGVVDVVAIRVLELVFSGGSHAPIFLSAASIRRGNGADAGEIAPGVVVKLLAPALCGRRITLPPGLILVKRFGGGEAVEGIIRKELGSLHIEIVVDTLDVAVVVTAGVGVGVPMAFG